MDIQEKIEDLEKQLAELKAMNQFKVGDLVIIKEKYRIYGDNYKVRKISVINEDILHFEGNTCTTIERVRGANEKEILQWKIDNFKEGDIVVVEDETGLKHYSKGDIIQIHTFEDSHLPEIGKWVFSEDKPNSHIPISSLREATQQEIQEYEENDGFRVGDIVVVDNLDDVSKGIVGDIYRINRISNIGDDTSFIRQSTCYYGEVEGRCFFRQNLRKATQPEIENCKELPVLFGFPGESYSTKISYGCIDIHESTIIDIVKSGVVELIISKDGKVYKISKEDLLKLYRYCKREQVFKQNEK